MHGARSTDVLLNGGVRLRAGSGAFTAAEEYEPIEDVPFVDEPLPALGPARDGAFDLRLVDRSGRDRATRAVPRPSGGR